VAPETIDALERYPWPGNVRELQNYVERAIVLSTGAVLTPDLFPAHVRGLDPMRRPRHHEPELGEQVSELVSLGIRDVPDSATDLYGRIVSMVEKELITQVLRRCQGVQTKAAVRLGINRNTLHKKIEEYGLETEVR
jgi:DNA-binding NtrC family response regulator